MTLIHTALLCEAQSFIEFYKLKKVNSKIYKNDDIIILISGVGKENTISTLDFMFINYDIKKAINIGVVGCNDKNIKIGELFCTNRILKDINHLLLKTVDKPQTISDIKNQTLYDMEGKYFLDIASKYLNHDDIFIFKIVSDYLNSKRLKKDYIKSLIKKKIKEIKEYLHSSHKCNI